VLASPPKSLNAVTVGQDTLPLLAKVPPERDTLHSLGLLVYHGHAIFLKTLHAVFSILHTMHMAVSSEQ
jgi:hypothetical protein